MAALMLFHSPVERWSGFARLVLEEKELEYDVRVVNSLLGEQLEPWYMEEIDENGALPALVHGNKVVCNSLYMARYIDRRFAEPALLPSVAEEQSEMDKWLEKADSVPDSIIYRHDSSSLRLWISRQQVLHQLESIDAHVEELDADKTKLREAYKQRSALLETTLALLGDKYAAEQAIADIEEHLDALESVLKQHTHIAGGSYTLADAAWTAILNELELARRESLWDGGRRRAVARWYRRMKARPSYDSAYIDHPVTLDMLIPYWGMLAKRAVQGLSWQSIAVSVLIAALVGKKLVGYGRGPALDAPIMITF